MVTADVATLVRAVRPVVVAVIVRLGLLRDDRAGRLRARAMRFAVVDEHHHVLRVHSAGLRRGLGPRESFLLAADHDHPAAEDELRVDDLAGVSLDLELDLEAEGATQPIDGRRGIFVPESSHDARPAGRGRFHESIVDTNVN